MPNKVSNLHNCIKIWRIQPAHFLFGTTVSFLITRSSVPTLEGRARSTGLRNRLPSLTCFWNLFSLCPCVETWRRWRVDLQHRLNFPLEHLRTMTSLFWSRDLKTQLHRRVRGHEAVPCFQCQGWVSHEGPGLRVTLSTITRPPPFSAVEENIQECEEETKIWGDPWMASHLYL